MYDEESLPDTDMTVALEENVEDTSISQTVRYVKNQFQRAEDKKRSDEQRLLKAYRNFRGNYGTDVAFTETEKSKIFVKVTKTKVLAAYGQIVEVLFGNNKFPLTVDPTHLPEGVSESVSFDPQGPPKPPTQAPVAPFGTRDGPDLPPGSTVFDLPKLGPLAENLSSVADRLVEGPGVTPTAVTFHPAQIAAKKMEKKIMDQLDESGASMHLRSTAFEMALFGTGIMKGPFVDEKEYPNWTEEGEYEPVVKTVPRTSHVSVWHSYPDPDAANMAECEFFIERHKLSRTNLIALKKRPLFRASAIDDAIAYGPNYERKDWEMVMEDGTTHPDVERWEGLEFWGYVPTDLLEEMEIPLTPEIKKMEQVNVNIWVVGNEVIRFAMNPFKPSRIPYYAVPYELNPYSFFGVGVAENMEDTQLLMNGFMRMAVDNAVYSGSLVFEIDENNLAPGEDLEIFPGKVIRRNGGAPGQSLFAHKFPNVTNENMMMFDKARLLADESTGFPSYAHGQTGIQGVGRTASGISMLMNAANGNIRTVVKNLDDYLISPLGKAFFSFNMQFDFDKSLRGDLEINSRGTESLMANEVRSQRLMQFLGVVLNPMLAPFVKLDNIVRDIAISLDLDPDKVTNSMADAAIQAEILKQFRAEMPQPEGGDPMSPSAPSGASGSVPGADAFDTTGSGGGNIGTGSVPSPGMQGFSANNSTV